jgi:hypothetical protein
VRASDLRPGVRYNAWVPIRRAKPGQPQRGPWATRVVTVLETAAGAALVSYEHTQAAHRDMVTWKVTWEKRTAVRLIPATRIIDEYVSDDTKEGTS